jgi:hypothetical protein
MSIQIQNYYSTLLGSSKNSIDSDALNFIYVAGITQSYQKNAINTLVKQLKLSNIWSKLTAVYPVVGGNATSHSYNLKNTSEFQLTFYNSPTHDINGINWNGSSTYADTGFIPSSSISSDNSGHVSYYARTLAEHDNVNASCGCFDGSHYMQIITGDSVSYSNNTYAYMYSSTLPGNPATGYVGVPGLFLVNIPSDNMSIVYFINGTHSITNSSSGSRPSYNLFLGAENDAYGGESGMGGADRFSYHPCSWSSIGESLSTQEMYNYETIVQQYQTNLGRAV